MAGSIGPTGHLPASDDPTLGRITFRELVEVFTEQARGLVEGGADLIIIETAQDILEVKAADLRRARGLQADRPHAADPDERVAAAAGRQDAARHRHPGGAHHADRARRRRDRAQLLHRARGHARRDPLPGRDQPGARALHPERRAAAPGARTARRSSPRSPTRWRTRCRSSSSATAISIVGGCCGTTPDHIRAIVDRVGGRQAGAAPRTRACARVVDDDRHAAGAGAAPDARGRAGELAGLAQGEGAAARRRLRRARAGRRGPGARAARTCSTSASR